MFLNGPINDTIVQSLRITDIDFIEYEGFRGHSTGDQALKLIADEAIVWLQNATIAADMLKSFLNDLYLPNWDLTPL